MREVGPAARRVRPDEVVIGLSPAFAVSVWRTLGGATVAEALRQLLAGIEEEGVASRIVRVARSLDVGNVGWTAAGLSGSLIGIGIQGKGTAVIHRADLPLLANLELLSNAALVDGPRYRALGRNAARYARGDAPEPVLLPESSEPFGPRYHARVVALVAAERACVRPVDPVDVEVSWT